VSAHILEATGIEKTFGAVRALGPIDLKLARGERLGIIGPNGSGKTTLINCISGTLRPERGKILFDGTDITKSAAHKRARLGLSRSFQVPKPFSDMSVLENLLVPLDQRPRQDDARQLAMSALQSVGLERRAMADVGQLSQLELRKLELARALVGAPNVLVADEAMAGLSKSEIDDILVILNRLSGLGIAIIMIEHIMHAVMQFSTRVLCLEMGRLIADETPAEIVANPHVKRVYFGEQARR
jgi:branched-chain amino acid transport system ATP-binding protein